MTGPADDPFRLPDGRFTGDDGDYRVELRVDTGGAHVISGDLFRARDYLASVRTAPGLDVRDPAGSWDACWQAHDGRIVTGRLAVEPSGPERATVQLRLDADLNGAPGDTDLTVEVQWAGAEFRVLGIEIETEAEVVGPEPIDRDGIPVTFRECLRSAGYQVDDVGEPTGIPREPGWEWDESVVYGVLDDLMDRTSDSRLEAPDWRVHLLMLGMPTMEGLFGVMFDVAGALPRQGCAVFVDEIRRWTDGADAQNRLITHTMAHEVGHALNLVHRFERPLGRADSTSAMNYFWRYKGGRHEDEYWERFAYRYDPDEVLFLRHAPLPAVMPGMSPFHTVDYWDDPAADEPAHLPGGPTPGFRLWLDPPATGATYEFGQPVYLQVSLRNTGDGPVALPPRILDVKAGYLEILVERVNGSPAEARAFVPVVQRCVDFTPGASDLQPQETWFDNVNLTFGAAGFTMAEPGTYRLTPILTVGDPEAERFTLVIRGEPRTVSVRTPRSRRDEQQAAALFRPEVGAWFALGGSEVLRGARDVVETIAEERARTHPGDPIAAAITRSLAIHASRAYVRAEKKGDFVTSLARTDRAAALLAGLVADGAAMRTFDPATASSTRRLAEDLRSGASVRRPRPPALSEPARTDTRRRRPGSGSGSRAS